MSDDTKRDELASTDKEIFEEARDRLKIAMDAEAANRAKAKNDLKFAEGDQWDDDPVVTSASMEEVELTINLTDAMVNRVVNNIKQQRPRGKCHPIGEGASIETAETINGLGRHVETRSEASIAYDHGADMATRMGWGYFRLIAEYLAPDSFERDLRILPVFNTFTVYMDPSAVLPTAADAKWCVVTVKMKRSEYKRLYPTAENASWSDGAREDANKDWENKEEIRLAEYFRIREIPEKLYKLRAKDGREFTRYKSDMPADESLAQAELTIAEERDSYRGSVEWFRLNGTKVVEKKVLPGEWIPVFRVQGNARDIDGEVVRRGMVRALIDPARMVNYGEVAKIKRLGLTPKAPWVGAEGQFDGHPEWDDANRIAYSKLVYKPVTVTLQDGSEAVLPPPQRQPPAQIEAGFSEFVQGMRTNLMAVAGMPNEPGVDQVGVVVSGKALSKRQHLSDQSHFQYYDNLTLAIAQCWRVMLQWFPAYYTGERMQRIIHPDGKPEMITLNKPVEEDGVKRVKNDLSIGRFDVVMDTGPGYETKREEGAETLIGLLNIKPLAETVAKVGADLVFRSLDHPYMQELADRLAAQTPDGLKKIMEGLPDRAKALVQAMAAENQQLKQALQAAEMENKLGMQKEQLRSQTQTHATDTKAETDRFGVVVKSKTDLAKEEIKAGTAMMNDMVDHTHQAKLLIAKGEQDARTSSGS